MTFLKNPLISLVIPVFNEQDNIEKMVLACETVMKKEGKRFEMIFVNDGSSDETSKVLREMAKTRPYLKGLVFSRNFGHQPALHAGLEKSKGDYVITMDGDLQHPPSLIPALISKAEEGFLVVNTRRKEQDSLPLVKKISSRWYYSLLNFLSDVHIEPASADFRLMQRKAVDVFLSLPERQRFNRGLVAWLGFNQTFIDYEPGIRVAGVTKFSFLRMLRFGLDGVTSFSVKPLRLAFYLGSVVSVASILYGFYAIVIFALGKAIAGWTSLLVSMLFLGGVVLICLGVIGEYVARIYNEVRARPIYILQEEIEYPENH
jgi:glycosyltransferase involved in cell wall biosynthesis